MVAENDEPAPVQEQGVAEQRTRAAGDQQIGAVRTQVVAQLTAAESITAEHRHFQRE